MSDEPRNETSNAIYMNLLGAYLALVQMRDYVRFLAKVTEPRDGDHPELMVRPEELVWCFSGLGTDLNDLADTIRWAARATHQLTNMGGPPGTD